MRDGYETAIASALGSASDAVAVDQVATAVTALEKLKSEDLGRAGMLLGGGDVDDSTWPGLPDYATYAVDVVEAPAALQGALRRLLFKVAVVDDLDRARDLVDHAPDVTAATRDGDLLGKHFASGGSSASQSLIEVQAAIGQTEQDLTAAQHTLDRLRFEAESRTDRSRRRPAPASTTPWRSCTSPTPP